MSKDSCSPLWNYCPSEAVQERIGAIKAERMAKAEAEAEALRLAIEKGKIEWEVEILMGLEDGKGPSVDILALPLEAWPEHDMAENVRKMNEYHTGEHRGRRQPVSPGMATEEMPPPVVRIVGRHEPGFKRHMELFQSSGGRGYGGFIIHPRVYRQLVEKSTVLKDELSLAEALDAVQMGLIPDVVNVIMPHSLIRERAKFRLALLRKIYPSLHEHALAEKLALEHERARLEKALTELKGGGARR